jgi:hypothetical protein
MQLVNILYFIRNFKSLYLIKNVYVRPLIKLITFIKTLI